MSMTDLETEKLDKIESELREFSNGGQYKLKRVNNLHAEDGHPLRVKIDETDKGVNIKVNPKRIRTKEQLDQVIHDCLTSLEW